MFSMNYSKTAAMVIRFFGLYQILYGLTDIVYAMAKFQADPRYDLRSYIVISAFRMFLGLLLHRLSLPMGRKIARDLDDEIK